MMKKHLQIWMGDEGPQTDPADLPTPEEVLYQTPNPDESRKACGNCVMYATRERSCYIHEIDLDIDPLQVCGYYVHGTPLEKFENRLSLTPVVPELSGLVETSVGSSCDICMYYSDDGRCHAVQQDGEYAQVDPLGCCTRWIAVED